MANTYIRIGIGLSGGGGSDSFEVKVSLDDKNPGFLEGKLNVGSDKLVKTVIDPGVEEILELDVDQTKIDHDQLLNFDETKHKVQDDTQTSETTLWSSQKTQDELDTKVDKVSSTDNAIPKFDGIQGDLQDSGIIIDDSDNVTGVNDLTVDGDLTVNGNTTTVNTATLDVEDANITVNKGGNTASADSQAAGITVDLSDGTNAQIGYDSSLESKFKAGEVGSEQEILTTAHSQTISNKTVDSSNTLEYDNSSSSLNSNNVKEALDELDGQITSNQDLIVQNSQDINEHLLNTSDAHDATAISYDNSISGLMANNAQDAIDELNTSTPSSVQAIYDITNEPTGFPNRNDSVVTFDDMEATLTIQPSLDSFDVYIKGRKFTKNSEESVALDTTVAGNHYFYYDNNGVLRTTSVFFPEIFSENAIVSVVYWNTDLNQHVYFAEERHGLQMDGATHGYLHTTFGARYISGLALENFNEVTNEPTLQVDQGSIRDEDLLLTIPTANNQDIGIMYRIGNQWRKVSGSSYPLLYGGLTSDYFGLNLRIPYNEFNGTNWVLTQADNNAFVLVHYFATNDKETPIVAIQGTNQYNNVPDAKNAAAGEINLLEGLPFLEFVSIGTVIYETSDGFVRPHLAEYVPIEPGVNYVDFRGTQPYTPAGTATSHSILSGLSNDDHIQYHTNSRADTWYQNKFPHDLLENSITLLDNTSSFTSTSISFNGLDTNSFSAYVNVERGTSSEYMVIRAIRVPASVDWHVSLESVGDITGVEFDVTGNDLVYKTTNTGNDANIRIKLEGLRYS